MKRTVSALIILFIILGSLSLPANASSQSTGSHPFLTFSWTKYGENYTGGVVSMSDSIKLDKARISLYDANKKLMESGLLSEYSANRSFGQYLEFRDYNQNGKLDAGDIFILSGEGITEDWGVVMTYEPSGSLLSSRTLSNKLFSQNDEEKEDNTFLRFLIITFSIGSLLLVLVYIYTRKK